MRRNDDERLALALLAERRNDTGSIIYACILIWK